MEEFLDTLSRGGDLAATPGIVKLWWGLRWAERRVGLTAHQRARAWASWWRGEVGRFRPLLSALVSGVGSDTTGEGHNWQDHPRASVTTCKVGLPRVTLISHQLVTNLGIPTVVPKAKGNSKV